MANDIQPRIERLKAVKSAFILEAQSLRSRGLSAFARPLHQRAAQAELALAELFRLLGRLEDEQTSLFSAASCLVQASQFQQAIPVLESVASAFPEAEEMVRQCRGRKDEPLVVDSPETRALIALLLGKGLITEDEWAEALHNATAH